MTADPPPSTGRTATGGSPRSAPWVTRLRTAARLFALYFLLPLGVGNLLGPPQSGWAACMGATVMLGAAMSNGMRAAIRTAPLILVGSALASATVPGWGWVIVVTALAAASGIATRWGAGLAASLGTLMAVTVPAISDPGQILLMASYAAAGGLYGLVMARRMGAPETRDSGVATPRRSSVIAVALAAATCLAASLAVASGWEHANWIVVAVVVLGIPTPGLTEKLMLQRMVGQLLACTVVGLLAAVTENVVVMLVAAVVVLMLYLMSMGGATVAQVTYLSAFFMLPIAARSAAPLLVVQRLSFNLLGLAILLAVLAVVRRFGEPRPDTIGP